MSAEINCTKWIRLSGMNLIIDDTSTLTDYKSCFYPNRTYAEYISSITMIISRIVCRPWMKMVWNMMITIAIAVFYARCVETVKKLRWCPDVIRCHGWMTTSAPLYIKPIRNEPSFHDAKVVFSVYEDDFRYTWRRFCITKLMLKIITKKDLPLI